MPKRKKDIEEKNIIVPFSGASPTPIGVGSTNESYSSSDGKTIYINFQDLDSSGLSPFSGIQSRFTVTKITGATASTVNPTSFYVDTNYPKTAQLSLSNTDKLIDGLYNGSGILTTAQDVYVTYSSSTSGGFGTIPLLSDNDTVKSNVASFVGLGISNRTSEANGPVPIVAYTSTNGSKVYVQFREASPPLLPISGIGGFSVLQNSTSKNILNAYVLDPNSTTDGKIVVLDLLNALEIDDTTNPITVNYTAPSLSSLRLKDSSSLGNTAASFSGLAVTNYTSETTLPRVVDAFTSSSGTQYIYVQMSEPTLPGSTVLGFSVYVNNNLTSISSVAVGNTTYAGSGVSQYQISLSSSFNDADLIELDYQKQTTRYITDQSANLNLLSNFTNRKYVRNLYDTASGSIDNAFVPTESYVDENGTDIYVTFSINRYYQTLPATGINGFNVFVDGQSVPIKKAISLDSSQDNHVKITLYNRIYKGSTVSVGYIKGNLTDHNSNPFNTFQPEEIVNNATIDRNDLFDVLSWNDNVTNDIKFDYSIDEDTSELFRKSKFNIDTSVILDTEPPKGIVILNRADNEEQTGIKVHKFEAYGNDIEETGTSLNYDITTNSLAWSINLDTTTKISSLKVKLKRTNEILNTADKVRFDLFSNSSDNKPEAIVSSIGNISFSDLDTDYQTLSINISNEVTLEANTTYWIIASCDNIVPVDINNTPVIDISYHLSTGKNIAEISTATSSGWLITSDYSVYYKLTATYDTEKELSSRNYLLDIFEKPIREAVFYSDDSSYQKYELFGDKQSNYIIKKLSRIYEDTTDHANDIYPTVSKILIGASSFKPKNYVLEIRETPTSQWQQVFDTLTDESTLDNLVYAFDTPVTISDIRLVYKGDYFTIDSKSTLSVAAYDELSEVVSAQISHFSDFRDATDFNNSNAYGLVDFNEGLTDFENYSVTNNSQVFKGLTGNASSDILASVSFGSKIILASNNKIFTYYNNQVTSISNDQITGENTQITSLAVYNNKVYLGTSSGLIYSSLTGDFWTAVNGANVNNDGNKYNTIKPITSLGVMGNRLYIGTSKGDTSYPSLYSYDGKGIIKLRDFDATYEKVSCISSINFNLFVGLGGNYNSGSSAIYRYDGTIWEQTLATDYDNVEAMSYSTARNSIVAGFRGGNVWELPYINNQPSSWVKIYDTNSDKFFSIKDDVAGKYLFISGDNKSVVYVKGIDTFKVITNYRSSTNGLNKLWQHYNTYAESYSTDITDIENFDYQSYQSENYDLNYINIAGSGFTSNSKITLDGFVKAKEDGNYKFKLVTNMGAKLSLGGIAATSTYSSIGLTTDTNLITPQTYALNKNDLLNLKIDGFISQGTNPSLYLYWYNTSDIIGYELLPNDYLLRTNKIKSIEKLNNNYYGIGSDGKVYSFDVSFYETKTRYVYARFKDEVGNIQGITLSGKSSSTSILSDKITQDLNTVDNAYQTKGKIYQLSKNDDYSLDTKTIYTPNTRQYSIYAPDRKVKETGIYEAQPFFVPTLVKWGKMTNLIINKYSLNTLNGQVLEGLDAGTAVRVYIRSGNSRLECLNASWSTAYEISYINNNSAIPPIETQEINLQNYNGKWFQYKFELLSATKNLSPEIVSSTITYTAGTASYFFTKIFDTTDYDETAPVIRRGLLTSNELLNSGSISYGYLNTDDPEDIYDFNKYKEIIPNKVFEIDSPTSKIKFGILITSVGATPAVVYDFAVQLDMGDKNLQLMPSL